MIHIIKLFEKSRGFLGLYFITEENHRHEVFTVDETLVPEPLRSDILSRFFGATQSNIFYL